MERILVAVDGSKHSERVVDYASKLAKTMSAKIVLLHIVPQSDIPEGYKQYAQTEHLNPYSYLDEVGEQIVKKMGERITKKEVDFEGVYAVGHPGSKIWEIAVARKASVIVVGLQGQHGLAKLKTLGSTARRVIENSPVPVVIVP